MAHKCVQCDREFSSKQALRQHRRGSPMHARSFECVTCNRSFVSEEALTQHLECSPVHARSLDCDTCDRTFGSEEALNQHLKASPVHTHPFECVICNRTFGSEEALNQHLKDSPVHAHSFECSICNRSFGSEEALEQHTRYSCILHTSLETPLDRFFRSFPTFNYNPSLPPATSYARLQKNEGWRRGTAASTDGWDRYQDALENELRMWYGAENDLAAWHALCRAIGIEPLPQTCEKCEEVVRRTHVNIVDLIEWGRRRGSTEEKVQTFGSLTELQVYTKDTRKIFRNMFDRESGNVVLRHLLRRIFSGNI